jgi:hypothetical protein
MWISCFVLRSGEINFIITSWMKKYLHDFNNVMYLNSFVLDIYFNIIHLCKNVFLIKINICD